MLSFNDEYSKLTVQKEYTNENVIFYVVISGVKLVIASYIND